MARKILFVLILFLLLPISLCFADWSNQSRLVFYPCSVVNNSNVLINLAEDNTKIIENTYDSYGVTFNYSETKHLSLFRIEENLTNYKNDNPNASSTGILVTIHCDYSDENGWYFVNENNLTSKRHFYINVSKITRNSSGGGWGSSPTYDNMAEGSPEPISNTNEGSDGDFTFRLSFTGYSQPSSIVGYSVFADHLYDYDISIGLPPTDEYLQPGHYKTKMTVTIETYKTHSASASFTLFGLGPININVDDTIQSQTKDLVIRGYVGDDSLTITEQTSFIVSPGTDTYSMQLSLDGRKETPYDIAKVSFFHSESNNPKTTNASTKYSILISPTSNYLASYATDEKPYYFMKSGTEYNRTPENTVYYYLCNANGTELSKASGTNFPSGTKTYQIYATYNNPSRNTTTNKYDEEWTIDKEIYLKIDDDPDAAQYEPGVYFSYIYFTLMTN